MMISKASQYQYQYQLSIAKCLLPGSSRIVRFYCPKSKPSYVPWTNQFPLYHHNFHDPLVAVAAFVDLKSVEKALTIFLKLVEQFIPLLLFSLDIVNPCSCSRQYSVAFAKE